MKNINEFDKHSKFHLDPGPNGHKQKQPPIRTDATGLACGAYFLHPPTVIESNPLTGCPLLVCPVNATCVSPHCILIVPALNDSSMSISPSLFTSFKTTSTGLASMPVRPNKTVAASTAVASKPLTLRIATLISLLLLGFILLASFFGRMSIATNPPNSTAPISQTPSRRCPI